MFEEGGGSHCIIFFLFFCSFYKYVQGQKTHCIIIIFWFILQLCLDPEDVYYPSTYLEIAIKKSQMPLSLTLISMLTIIDTVEHNCTESPGKVLNMLPLLLEML